MNIYIMSRGRADKFTTPKWIPAALQDRLFIVVPQNEVALYNTRMSDKHIIAAPDFVTNYSQKVQWIIDGLPGAKFPIKWDTNPKCLIMDDDLVFSARAKHQGSYAGPSQSLISIKDREQLLPMYEQIGNLLDSYALVGIHPRQMGQHAKAPYTLNGRIICIQGINRDLTGPVKVDQFPILADVVLNCTLLSRGKANAIITTFFQDHGPCQAPGGCSTYRTHEMQRQAVDYLANRFPGFVKVVPRVTKDKWLANEEGIRYDYTCQWKSLYAAGLEYARGMRGSPDREVSVPTSDSTGTNV